MITAQFVDISAFNPASIDWQAYKAWSASGDGVSRVAMRSSYGVGYVDSHFEAYRAGALAAGIDSIIYYHYAYPQFNSPALEANYQRSVVGNLRDSDMVMLDFEEQVTQATAQWAFVWLQTQEANYGKMPGIYSYPAFIQAHLQYQPLAKYPLWYANWQYSPDERPAAPAPWGSYEWLQYSDRATIPGIAGIVDANIFLGKENTNVNGTTYGPDSRDFGQWFTVGSDGNWMCKQTKAVLMGGNKALYSQLSMDGNTLPIVGLPIESEQYHADADGYQWSSQKCERGEIIYDPRQKHDTQPGMGTSYLAHVDYNPPTVTVTALPSAVTSDLQQIAQIADKYK